MQTHPNHVCVAHKPLMLVMEDNLTHVIPKVCIFFPGWLSPEKVHVRAEVYLALLKLFYFGVTVNSPQGGKVTV